MNNLFKIGMVGVLFVLSSCVFGKKDVAQSGVDQAMAVKTVIDGQGRTLYEVSSTDTLSSIAARFSTTTKEIITLNNLQKPYVLKPGQLVQVPNDQDFIVDTPQEPIAIKISPKIKS